MKKQLIKQASQISHNPDNDSSINGRPGEMPVENAGTNCFAATKLHAPARRHDALVRPRLLDILKNSLASARLTLVSAPAGAGKTSLLAESPHAFTGMRWAWLLLDDEDNDPSRFAAAIVASLQQLDSSLGEGALTASQPGTSAGRQAVTAIINNVVRSVGDPIALVIDDYHVIGEESVHQTVEYLIDRLPPNMRVVIGSRHDPPMALSRWRARGELAEIRLSDLSFTERETADLINSCLKLSLDPESLHALYSRTEGWAAGLRLLATSIAQAPSSSRALLDHGMQGRQRIFEFLSEEVLDRQKPELQQFLLETSILSSLNAPACDALTGRKDSHLVLEKLYRQNLYVAAVDETGRNYRYHDLFADFLRDRLQRKCPDEWTSLHERAALIESEPSRRIRHWTIAGNWEQAATEIERIGPDYVRRGFAVTLRRWILEVPEPVRRGHPRLALLLGTSIWVRSELGQAQSYFEEALEGFRQRGDEAGQVESLMALSITANMFSQPERARILFGQALRFPLPAASRLELHAAAGWDALNQRDWSALHQNLDELLDLIAEPTAASNPFAYALMIYGTSFPGFLDRLDLTLPRLQDPFTSASEFSRAYYYALRAACLQFRGDIAGSRQSADAALGIGRSSELPLLVRLSAMVTLLMGAFSDGDWDRAGSVSAELISEHAMAPFLRRWKPLAAYYQGRARWLAGDFAGIEESYRQIASPEPEESPQPQVNRLLLAGILRLCERAYARAQETFEEAWRLQQEYRTTAGSSSAAVLLAYVHLKRGHTEEALDTFSPYLADADRLNGPGYILRENPIVIPLLRLSHAKGRHRAFVERCLGLLRAPLHVEEETGGEALSERELEVLQVMAEGLGNRAIGERLFVSEATVKTHVQRILRKLDASSRTQAVARARELMLL